VKGVVGPPRLRDASDSPSELVRALELSRADLPAASDLNAIASNLATLPGGAGAHFPGKSPPLGHGSVRPVATGGATGLKLVGAAVVIAAIGAGVLWQNTTQRADRLTASAHAGSAELTNGRRASEPAHGQGASAASRETRARDEAFATQREHASPAAAPPASLPPSVGANVSPAPRAEAPASKRRFGAPSARAPDAPRPAAASAAPDSSTRLPTESGPTEIALLNRAQGALRGEPARALELVAEHARRFPGGALVQEREFIAIQALVGLSRSGAAAARARRFRAAFPDSAHLRRLDLLFGDVDGEPVP
jgi:hypothetical protein